MNDAIGVLYDVVERQRRVEELDGILGERYHQGGGPPGLPADRRALHTTYRVLLRAFPDLETTVLERRQDGDRIVVDVERSGTQTGNLFNVPASGRRITFRSTETFTVADDGRIATRHDGTDWGAVFGALGFFDVPEGPSPGVRLGSILVPTADLVVAERFYRAVLEPFGYSVRPEGGAIGGVVGTGDRVAFVGPGEVDPCFRLAEGELGENRIHFAFRFGTTTEVERFHALALAAGGHDNGGPGPRSFMPPNYFGAFVIDEDGHEVEAVCWGPLP